MGEADGFHQVFIGAKRAGNRTPNLRDLNGVGQAGAVIVSFVIDEDLRLVFQTAESGCVDDPFAVALETCAIVGFFLRILAPFGILAADAVWRKGLVFNLFKLLSGVNHSMPLRELYV